MATFTVEVASKNAGDWTLDAGSDVVSAVQYGGSHDDDTSKIQSLNAIGSYQEYNVTMTGGPSAGDTITQVAVTARVKRALSSDANYSVSYSFTKSPSGTQSGTSPTQTSTSSWTTYTYTDSGLSAVYGSGFKLKITAEQARYLECSTLYAVVTYTPAPTNQTLTGAVISSTATVYAPTKITKKLAGATIASGAVVRTPVMITKKMAGAVISSGATLYAPAKISYRLSGATIASGATLYAPSSVTVADAPQVLAGATLASTAALYAPSRVNHGLGGATIASTASLPGGMVYRGTIRIDGVMTHTAVDVDSISLEYTFNSVGGDSQQLLIFIARTDGLGASEINIDGYPIKQEVDAGSPQFGLKVATARLDGVESVVINITAEDGPDYEWVVVVVGLTGMRPIETGDPATWGISAVDSHAEGIDSSAGGTNGLIIGLGAATEPAGAATGSAFLYPAVGGDYPEAALFMLPAPTAGTYSNIGPNYTSDHTAAVAVWVAEAVVELRPPAWSASTTLHAPARVSLPGQTLDGAAVASTAAVYAPAMVAKLLGAPTIAGGAVVRTPAKVNHRLGGATITGGARYAPTVTPGTRTLAGAHISATAVHAPGVRAGGLTLEGAHIALTPETYAPAAVTPGGVTLKGRAVDVGTVVHAPRRVDNVRLVAPPAIDSTAQVYAPASATVRLYIYAPHIGCETPMAINSPALVNLATVYAMTALHMRLYGATINGGTVHAPAAIASGPRVQTGDVFPPEEVGTV